MREFALSLLVSVGGLVCACGPAGNDLLPSNQSSEDTNASALTGTVLATIQGESFYYSGYGVTVISDPAASGGKAASFVGSGSNATYAGPGVPGGSYRMTFQYKASNWGQLVVNINGQDVLGGTYPPASTYSQVGGPLTIPAGNYPITIRAYPSGSLYLDAMYIQ